MMRKSNRKTPLGDKFDEIDFPIEPSAWSEMATLLPPPPPQGPLSIFKKFGFFIASIPLFLMAFWQLSSAFSRDKNAQLTAAETSFSRDKNAEKSSANLTELYKINSIETALTSSLMGNKTTLELSLVDNKTALKRIDLTLNSINIKSDLIDNQNVLTNAQLSVSDPKTALEFDKKALKTKGFLLKSINKKTDLIDNKNALMDAQLSTNSIDDKRFLAANKAVLMRENLIKNALINKDAQTSNQPVLSVNNQSINAFNAEKKGELMGDLSTKNNSDFAIKNTLDSTYALLNKDPLNGLIAVNSENLKTSLNNSELVDNQLVTLSENKKIIAELGLRELSNVYSDSFQNINNLAEIGALLPTSLMPISQLWRGNHHQISVGFGHASLEFNNHARPAINRFRLAYNYRITPLLGIGTSTNYVLINPKGYYSTTEAELNLYFINRQRFDAFLSAGYGYRQWDFQNNASETLTGRGRGFTLGLNAQYAINHKYTMGFRVDLKQVAEPDFGLLLVFSRCF